MRDLATGKLSVSSFAKLEARREANRLRGLWKRDAWLAGQTIDLDNHEAEFRRRVGPALMDLPPSIADWLRWQYWRFQVVARNDERWNRALTERLPERVRVCAPPAFAIAEGRLPMASMKNPAVPTCDGDIDGQLAGIATENWATLQPFWREQPTALERSRILSTLRDTLIDPADAAARARWISLLLAYRVVTPPAPNA